MFLTLTCPSYGRVSADGTPADPDAYDYQRAARDALHFAALFDRFIQNLRRFLGYDLQYFAAVEPQRRLAPHIHVAMRGTISRAELRQVLAATYHQVWWPPTSHVRHDDAQPARLARGHRPLPRPGDRRVPAHLGPGPRRHRRRRPSRCTSPGSATEFDAQGVLAGSRDAARCIGYLTKYLTKHVADCHQAAHRRPARARRTARRRAALRAVLADLRELAALRRPAQEPPRGPAARPLQGQSPPPRAPRLRRTPRPGLPQVVRQDPGRPPRRPQSLAPGNPRPPRHRPRPATPGNPSPPATPTTCPRARRLLHVVAERQRMARRARPGPRQSQRPDRPPDLSATGRAA